MECSIDSRIKWRISDPREQPFKFLNFQDFFLNSQIFEKFFLNSLEKSKDTYNATLAET